MAKRFYKNAVVARAGDGWEVRLDDKPLRTPARADLILPAPGLADAIAAEWNGQGEKIDPGVMPLTRLANTAIDRVKNSRGAVADDIASYAANDLVCYRADAPDGLVALQQQHWDPALAAIAAETGATFVSVTGILHKDQPVEALAAIRKALDGYDAFALSALHMMTTLTGSAILAVLHTRGRLGAEEAWAAAHVDEDWQVSQWGEDDEASARRAARWREMEAAARILELCSTPKT